LNAVLSGQQNQRTFAVTARVYTFWLACRKECVFRLTTKIVLFAWMASFTFLLWQYLLQITRTRA